MNSEYWIKSWNQSAKNNIDLKLISGWGNRTFQEMMFAIVDITKKLQLSLDDILLDVGCGAGIFEIVFSYWLKKIYAVDYSSEMVRVAKQNTVKFSNVVIEIADIKKLPFSDNFFDKILVNSVIQYLNNLNEVTIAFKELKRVVKPMGLILISMNLDKRKKVDYIKRYKKLNFTSKEVKNKISALNKVLWFDPNDLIKIGNKLNLTSTCLEIDKNVWQSKYYFDILLRNK